MREILFRGKRMDNGEWVEGYYAGYDLICPGEPENTYNATGDYFGQTPYVGFAEVDPATVGRYTGLKDKNGKRIFEGDIVRIVERGKTADGGIIVFENGYPGGWLVTDSKGESKCSLAMRTDVEVIGNINDNPGLLKGDNDNA